VKVFRTSTGRLAFRIATAAALFALQNAHADFHDWTINEIYSNADGSVQFIELSCPTSGEGFLRGERISCISGNRTNVFTFPSDLSGDTADAKLLLATPGFAALPGGITPDFVIPTNFVALGGGRLNYANVDVLNYTNLPSNGVASLVRSGSRFVNATSNSPENFAGARGSIVPVRFSAVTRQGTNLSLSFSTVSGRNYAVQFTDSLELPTWQNLTTVSGNGATRTAVDSVIDPRRFYRLRVP
jgi:hypothetical protein